MSNTEGDAGIAAAVAPASDPSAATASNESDEAVKLKAQVSKLEKDINTLKSVKDKETDQERRARIDLEARLSVAEQALEAERERQIQYLEQYEPDKAKEAIAQRTQEQQRKVEYEAGWARWENHALKTALAAGATLDEAQAIASVRGNPEQVQANLASFVTKKKAETTAVTDREALKKELLDELRKEGAIPAPAAQPKTPVTPVDREVQPGGISKVTEAQLDALEKRMHKARNPSERTKLRAEFKTLSDRYKAEQTA